MTLPLPSLMLVDDHPLFRQGLRMMLSSSNMLQADIHEAGSVTDAVAQLAAANNVQFVDLRPGVEALKPETLWVSPTDAHPNRTANLRFAAQLRQAVLQSAPGTTPAPDMRIH